MNTLFKALNDPIRREILELLRKRGDLNAGEIAEAFHVTKPTISHHLDLLRQADLIQSEKKGQFVIYSLNTTVVEEILEWVMGLIGTKEADTNSQVLRTDTESEKDKIKDTEKE